MDRRNLSMLTGLLLALGGVGYLIVARAKPIAAAGPSPAPAPTPAPEPTDEAKPVAGLFSTAMQKFVAKAWDGATNVAKAQGWPMPSGRDFVLAQSAWESGINGVPGVSYLTTHYNNLFGIKADASWKGKKTPPLWTWESIGGKSVKVQAYFRAYDSWEESMRDWIQFISAARYADVKKAIAAGNPKGAFLALEEAKYATDPNYAQRLTETYAKVRSVIV